VKELTPRREDAMGAKPKIPCGFAPLRLCVENFPAEDAAPTGLGSSPGGWERIPQAGEGFGFFGFGSTNMPRRRRWGTNAVPKSFCDGRLGQLAFECLDCLKVKI
jgi:hypothetical protein